MAQEIEIEYKNLLTEKEFNQLLYYLPFPPGGKIQTNYYFETKDFALKNHKSALRIREKNGAWRLTLKEPQKVGLLETHDLLTKQEAEAIVKGKLRFKGEVSQQLKKLNVSFEDLIYYGSLKTVRRETNYEGVLLVLDYSTYNGTADYELELEAATQPTGKRIFDALLEKYNIPERKTPNKIERFFSTL